MRRVGALLGCLVLRAPQPAPREELLDLLWPDEPIEITQPRLRVLLSDLRKHLEKGATSGSVMAAERKAIQLVSGGYTSDYNDFVTELRAAKLSSSDTGAILHLENCAALYRGELLAGFSDEWILTARAQIAEQYYQAIRDLTHRLSRTGFKDRAIEYARRAVSSEPFDEEAHCDVIRLYSQLGQPSAALRQYEQLRKLLADQMQAQPSRETRRLAAEIESQIGHGMVHIPVPGFNPIALRASEQSPTWSLNATNLPSRLTRFFARRDEISTLTEWLAPTSATRLVSLLGPGGIGKTRLSDEVADRLSMEYRGGVYFAALAEINDQNHVGLAISRALRLPPTPESSHLHRLWLR